jgi:hypothetical protein
VQDDREAANQEITDAFPVEGAAEPDEILELRCPVVETIWLIIHASASSNDEKR